MTLRLHTLLLASLTVAGCEPAEDTCTAAPTCKEGETQVADEAGCLQDGDDAVCYESSSCGETIWCTGPDLSGMCTAIPMCAPGETEVASQADCLQDDAVCYEATACGVSIWCTGPDPATCTAVPTCREGETEVASQADCVPAPAVCYEVTECDTTIWCTRPATSLTTVLGGGFLLLGSHGACQAELCDGLLELADDTARFRVMPVGHSAVGDNSGTLTAEGVASASSIAEALVGIELLETYGDPTMDPGIGRVQLSRTSTTTHHLYDYGQPPGVLEAADAFVTGLITALTDCTATEHIQPDDDCHVDVGP